MSEQVLTSNEIFCWQRGVTPLHLACRHGHTQVVRLLVDHGGDVNLPSRGGVCSLHLAARCGHSHVVELLLDKGEFYMHLPFVYFKLFFSVSQVCWQLLNGVSKKMSDVKAAILISWNQLILTNLTYIKQSSLTDIASFPNWKWPWYYSILYTHRSGNAQDAVVLQLCYWGRPLRPSSNSCYATAHDGCWAIRYQMRSLGNMLH